MRVRKLDAKGDMTFGQGQLNFWRDVPDAPAQVAVSRLRLEQGEWFLDRQAGTPWRIKVLGRRTEATRDQVIRARVLGTRGVRSIVAYDSVLDRDTRAFTGSLTIDTLYGRIRLSEPA